ncbi:MAG: DUF2851 family protein [Bacteroides sp.]|nr:DUF2851 family protein [Bacteroides sp.]MDD4719767.1 DUF2851 family protein [Bacteroides sp.]NLI63407.1 DUF2851 family protein [Bacteroidales bacterium]
MELLLHYVWRHKIFPLYPLKTTTGLDLEIIDPGLPNIHSGPDFFNAKLKINHLLWVGNVEIHQHASDWFVHKHQFDKRYDSVVLHVVADSDCIVRRKSGNEIPQVELKVPSKVESRYKELLHKEVYPRCYLVIPDLSKLEIHSWLNSLCIERYEERVDHWLQCLKKRQYNWRETFFIQLARSFGFGVNGDAFEYWANQLSFRAICKHRDNLFQLESLFLGQAGLLKDASIQDDYFSALQREYAFLKSKFNCQEMEMEWWRFLRLRPRNFPYIRLAQLAYWCHSKEGIASELLELNTPDEFFERMQVQTSLYWDTHYSLGKQSKMKIKCLGKTSLRLLLINTIVSYLFAYGEYHNQSCYKERAQALLEQLKAEDNRITRSWDGAGVPVHTAADSQGLIQLQKKYCDCNKCLYCRFGYRYLVRKS